MVPSNVRSRSILVELTVQIGIIVENINTAKIKNYDVKIFKICKPWI